MESVYVVIENGVPYPVAYTTYKQALDAVKTKYKDDLELDEGPDSVCDVNVPENATGVMYLYIEKAIHIYIHRLPVLA